MIHTRYMKKQR